jgi:putative hydrolase of the HAD superfamily
MDPQRVDSIRRLCLPLEPIPTGESPQLAKLPRIRAVLFDIYGTMFVSGSGEVGTARQAAREDAMAEALAVCAAQIQGPASSAMDLFFQAIEQSHERSRQQGVQYPEVDILAIWRAVLVELARQELIGKQEWEINEIKRLAVEYEGRANPAWPMPGLDSCLAVLREKGILLGIISNAQFYTLELFPALLGERAESIGFDPKLQFYSYRHGCAKPGTELHEMAGHSLAERGILPEEVLYVGNDMLNDILPTRRVGFRSALFAGDRRSLRRRDDDPRVRGLIPDIVLTRLVDLSECIVE